ncbi:uncharacterized protein N0V89_000186 [Didymosphaeria variabile]|uniref:O-methyltransferase dimerisation domain-containing protein n=1 Tax=Didymosphaeria variabile TaxID=1932322 RepID=A0A9W9CFL4_9PLEO|nr:uncharacterized protein N0V89_000186 [Didymosphaeria variabile]KAJ4359631.1 hypothetical protein N0V89_000186 [Didymosphaeria variabile]
MSDIRAAESDDVRSLVSKLQAIDSSKVLEDEAVKNETLTLARKLVAALEGPVNRATDLVFRPYISIAARIAVDLDLFKFIAASNSVITSEQLALASGGDKVLISRVLRLLAAVDFVEQPSQETWRANETSIAMASAPIAAGHRFVFDVLINSAIKAPKFLRETGYKAPSEPTDGFVQYANQTKLNIFDFLQANPSLFQDFKLFMGNTMGAREYWHEWYDVRGHLTTGFDSSKSSTLLVDIGGGKGHDLLAFDSTFGSSPKHYEGKLVLQDLPQVLDGIAENELSANIMKMSHNFFKEQPVSGE